MNTPSSSHENTETTGGNTANTRDDDGADPGICPWCQQPVPAHVGRGRPRVWCSDQCRRDAHSARKAARTGAVGIQVIRQTRTIEKPVPMPVVEYRDPSPTATPARYLDDHDIAMHVLRNSDLLAKILDSFSAGLGPRLTGRQLTGPLHEAALRLAPRLDDYRRNVTPKPPEPAASRADTAGLSRQQRRALERLQAKKSH
ncbi:hypothetical protein [Prescottella subtropica]|uniref:hypothetical protein n=1 Tax=Prescottella subtropica TaxID=2545757 RepID=UPI0010F469A6|nr:hypothetical protein [Prescottella subtropica]